MKKLSGVLCIVGLSLFLLLADSSFVFATHNGNPGLHRYGGNRGQGVGNVPEPVSCLLLLAGGATLAGLRRWRNKRNSKNQ